MCFAAMAQRKSRRKTKYHDRGDDITTSERLNLTNLQLRRQHALDAAMIASVALMLLRSDYPATMMIG
jgi:hypothetical protein